MVYSDNTRRRLQKKIKDAEIERRIAEYKKEQEKKNGKRN